MTLDRATSRLGSALVLAQFALIGAIAWPWSGWQWSLAGLVIAVLGLSVGAWALAANPPGNFNIRPHPKAGARLATSGPYRLVRHPMYLAVLLTVVGLALGYAEAWRWGGVALLALVLGAKAGLEERAMARHHAGYAAYRARTRRILPFVW